MRDKAAKDTTNEEVGGFTIGVKLPIVDAQLDEVRDVAALRLDPNYILPEGPEFYDMRRSMPLMKWDEQELDGLTLLMFGFPIDNSREVTIAGTRKFMFMGCAEHMSNYSADLNTKTWARLSSQFSREKDFVFTYNGDTEEYKPHGFSGSGVWVLGGNSTRTGLGTRPNHGWHRAQLGSKPWHAHCVETACVHRGGTRLRDHAGTHQHSRASHALSPRKHTGHGAHAARISLKGKYDGKPQTAPEPLRNSNAVGEADSWKAQLSYRCPDSYRYRLCLGAY